LNSILRPFSLVPKPDIANAPNMAARDKLIAKLSKVESDLYEGFLAQQRIVHTIQLFIQDSGRVRHANYGRLNLAPLFVEIFTTTLGPEGACGLIAPTGIVSDDFARPLFHYLMRNNILTSFLAFENEDKVFPGIANVVRFGMLTARRGRPKDSKAAFGFY
jgi:hypothetical protein